MLTALSLEKDRADVEGERSVWLQSALRSFFGLVRSVPSKKILY